MGMAASQARLLSLTSRLHDIEYKAQYIESQKIALATQKDELYQNYNDALDAKKIQVAFRNGDGSKQFVDANFTTVCGYNPDRQTQYTLTDNKTGKIIVTDEEASMYDLYSCDKYSFAWAMLGYEQFNYLVETGEDTKNDTRQDGTNIYSIDSPNGETMRAMTWVEEQVYNIEGKNDSTIKKYYDAIDQAEEKDKEAAIKKFRDALYSNPTCRNLIFKLMNVDKEGVTQPTIETETDIDKLPKINADADFDIDAFNYYINLFEQIQNACGCIPIEEQYRYGDEANTWFNNMVNSGRVTISEYNNIKNEFVEVSVGTSTSSSYLQSVSDETELKKAEAEYEYELGIINNKDTKFDNELSKLETERTSITTEIESIGKVRDENIDRTFGIFS